MRLKIYILTVLFLLPLINIFCQDETGDSRNLSDTSIAYQEYRSAMELYNNGISDWNRTLRHFLKASTLYLELGDTTQTVDIYSLIGSRYEEWKVYNLAAQYAEDAYILIKIPDQKIESALHVARNNYMQNNFENSADWYTESYKLSEEQHNKSKKLESLLGLAAVGLGSGNDYQAGRYLREIVEVKISINESAGLGEIYSTLGLLEFNSGKIDSAISYYNLALDQLKKDGSYLAPIYSNLAICYQNKDEDRKTREYFELALLEANRSGDLAEKARIEHILAVLSQREGDIYHAGFYSLASIESAKASSSYDILVKSYLTYSEVLEEGNDFVKALDYYQDHLLLKDSLAIEKRFAEQEQEALRSRMENLERQLRLNLADDALRDLELRNLRIENENRANDLRLLETENEVAMLEKESLQQNVALEKERYNNVMQEREIMMLEQQRLLQRRDSILQENESRDLMQKNRLLEYEGEQQQQEIEREQQKRRWAILMAISAAFSLVIILLSLISTRKKNTKLTTQKKIIEEKNLTITDSIEYASRIQNAVLPPGEFLSDWGLDSFIMFRPKDIVSGDFYWGAKSGDLLCFAAADCTGHGVPGAFMSMLGTAFLNEIINSRQFENAADILNQLRDEVISSLKQKGVEGEAQDGMDIALCVYDKKENKLHFAGANNPLYHISGDIFNKIGPDKMPIGIHVSLDKPFTNYTLKPAKGDLIYLFSDGYADQFGGKDGKKFMYKTFRNMLIENKDLSLDKQHEIVEQRFDDWKGELEQVDDVILLGIRF